MKRLILISLFTWAATQQILAQEAPTEKKCMYLATSYYDVALGAGLGFSGALSWNHFHGFGKKEQRFKVGYGLRFTSYFASDADYTTAPARLTSTRQDIFTIFSDTKEESIDTVRFASANTNSLNASIHLQYSFGKKIEAGFNIDAIGISFGGEKKGVLISDRAPASVPVNQTAKPTSFNLLLTSDNDIGSLNSELYVRYWVTEKIGIRAGFSFLFSEYRLDQKLEYDNNDRYRTKAGLGMVALTYRPFRK